MTLLECVPNVSEGRRPDVLARLARAAGSGGAHLLHSTADADHNRSVFTLAGTPPALHRALLALFEVALAEIDLRGHEGVHPRVGAVDVVPFVPLAGSTTADAAAAARRLGAEVSARFALPVWLYEDAAPATGDPLAGRRALPDLRRGGFEGLTARLADAAWRPDFGSPRPHPSAGASIVGARFFLVAWNVVLATPEVATARAVARSVRTANGGLPALRAIGVPLRSRGLVQVSMNLLDFRRTSMVAAFRAVAEGAAAHGAAIRESELIGLVPRAALPPDPERELLLRIGPDRILEERLAAAGLPVELPGL